MAGKRPHAVDLWHADRYDDSDLDAMISLAEALAREITGGKLG
jgi:hypothetical protein